MMIELKQSELFLCNHLITNTKEQSQKRKKEKVVEEIEDILRETSNKYKKKRVKEHLP